MLNLAGNTTLGALEKTLVFTERRHELLAGNIANMSTPEYRARDLDVNSFQDSLARSIKDSVNGTASSNSPAMRTSGGPGPGLLGHPMSSVSRDDLHTGPRSPSEPIVYHDNSDLSMEQQIAKISKNQHLHNLAIATMRNQMALLQSAITERV